MSFRSDDLAPLLVPPAAPDFGFHSGKVLTWNAETGANTISVAGATLADVPILNTNEAIQLAAGDVVGMLRFKSSYFILGRVTVPGSEQFASASVAFQAHGDAVAGLAFPSAETVVNSIELYGPAWANEAIVTVMVGAAGFNQSGSPLNLFCRPRYDGLDGLTVYQTAENLQTGNVTVSQTDHIFRSDFATNPIVCDVKAWTGGGAVWPADNDNRAYVHAFAVFKG